MLGWIIGGTAGGFTRFLILRSLHESPSNANQLATLLNKDYTTIRHHLKVLEENKLIITTGEGYGKTYTPSSLIEENYELLEEIAKTILEKNKKLGNRMFMGSLLFFAYRFQLLKSETLKLCSNLSIFNPFSILYP